MAIIAIHRKPRIGGDHLPLDFVVGQALDGPVGTDTAVIEAINLTTKRPEEGPFQGNAYRGPCYVVKFVDSNVRRVVPMDEVIDIAYEVIPKEKTEEPEGPELPTE